MITHVVIFTWIDGVTSAQVQNMRDALSEMAIELREITTIQHGPDLQFRDANGDYSLVATFSGRDAWDAYQAHPKHAAFVRDLVAPLQASRLTVQF